MHPPVSLFAEEFRAFAKAERRTPLPRDPVLFYGSSSIRLWETLAEDFPGLPVVNRGFGGSTLADCVQEMERLVFPLQPRAIVLYAGENDLDQGASAERIEELFRTFAERLDDRLGLIPLIFISIKPSPSRAWALPQIRQANDLIRAALADWPNARFVDVFPLMLDEGEKVRHELFTQDWLHLSRAGYLLWAAQVRACLAQILPSP
jgi:lysophospholipase L1-like esterase